MKAYLLTLIVFFLPSIAYANLYEGKLLRDHYGEIEVVDITFDLNTSEVRMVGEHGLKAAGEDALRPWFSWVPLQQLGLTKWTVNSSPELCRCDWRGGKGSKGSDFRIR